MTKVKTHRRRRGSKGRVGAGMFDSITNHPMFQKTQNAFNSGLSSAQGVFNSASTGASNFYNNNNTLRNMGTSAQGAYNSASTGAQGAYNSGTTRLGNAWSNRPKFSAPSMNTALYRGGQYGNQMNQYPSNQYDPNNQYGNQMSQYPNNQNNSSSYGFGGKKSRKHGRKGGKGRKGTRRH